MYRFAVVRRRLLINRRGHTSRRIVARRAAAGCDKYVARSARLYSMTAASSGFIARFSRATIGIDRLFL
jgi:hypothetical protein